MVKPSQLQQLCTIYQSNVCPGMLRDLAEQLGVKVEALERLQLGWAPIVRGKNGRQSESWWTIPERDATGKITGIGLRAQHRSAKSMILKSKRGLIYVPNPNHEAGAIEHRLGTRLWTRCHEVGIRCPICQHEQSDGCVIGGDINDPQAAICVRKKSTKPLQLGYLHRIKNIKFSASNALMPSKHPVLVVEGMTDVATAASLGLVAVGRPSSSGCLNLLPPLLRGRKAIIIGENDQKATGEWPGRTGMVATYEQLRDVCPQCIQILPPRDVKDFREWVTKYQLTGAQLLKYCEENAEETDETLVLEDSRTLTAAKAYLLARHYTNGRYTLRYFNDTWYQYSKKDNCYREHSKSSVAAPLIQWGHTKQAKVFNKDESFTLRPVDTTQAWVSNVMGGMASECVVPSIESPCWINGVIGPDPKDLLIFKNATIHIPSYLEGKPPEEYTRESTPDLFSLVALPYPFVPEAKCPALYDWINSSLGDDPDKIKLFQEWCGYCITQDMTQQKLLWMRGVPNGGKGVAISVLNNLVGKEQFTVGEFKSLTDKFEMIDMLGKLVCAFPDFKLPSKGDHSAALSAILSISGNDPVKMRQKFKESLGNVHPLVRFTLASNDLPNFPDHSGALKRRLLLLEFERSFTHAVDTSLKRRIARQIPGVAIWALEGLRRLKEQGSFTIPQSMKEIIHAWEEDANPVATFLRENTIIQDDATILKSELFRIYRGWCASMGSMPCSLMNFKQRLIDHYRKEVPFISRAKEACFKGIRVTDKARKAYGD